MKAELYNACVAFCDWVVNTDQLPFLYPTTKFIAYTYSFVIVKGMKMEIQELKLEQFCPKN